MRPASLIDHQLHSAVADALAAGDNHTLGLLADECDRRDRYTRNPPPQTATLHQAARWYAAQGIAVFPLRPGTKIPATEHGFKDATIDADQVDAWWTKTPRANIGLPTGLLFDVADLDGWGAVDVWAGLDDAPEPLGVVVTPRPEGGGRHVYVAVTGHGNSTNLMPKVDWRGQGGYVVAPPSVTADGTYWWRWPLKVGEL